MYESDIRSVTDVIKVLKRNNGLNKKNNPEDKKKRDLFCC